LFISDERPGHSQMSIEWLALDSNDLNGKRIGGRHHFGG
jgi:hypothetical protein